MRRKKNNIGHKSAEKTPHTPVGSLWRQFSLGPARLLKWQRWMVRDNPRLRHRHTTGLSCLWIWMRASLDSCSLARPHRTKTYRDNNGAPLGGWIRGCWSFRGPGIVVNVTFTYTLVLSFIVLVLQTQSSDSLRRCWADSWVAASGILSGNTAAPSDCWMIRNIRAPFRLVTCRPQFVHSAEHWIAMQLCLTWQTEGQQVPACPAAQLLSTKRQYRYYVVIFVISNNIRLMHFPHVTHYCQNTWVNSVTGVQGAL